MGYNSGRPMLPPNRFMRNSEILVAVWSVCRSQQFASKASLRLNSQSVPWNLLVPLLNAIVMVPPDPMP